MTDTGEHSGAPDIVIITGMSGAGRSTAAKSLEDLGWFVVDNLPPALLPTMLDLADRASLAGIAAIVDVRSRAFSTDLKSAISSLGARGVAPQVLFLEASDAALVRRFENVRRPHPMQGAGTILDGITAERELLRAVRGDSDIVLDTSALNVHELRDRMHGYFGGDSMTGLRLNIMTFGFKYGLPVDADLVADCRFLPNPHWVPELRAMSGQRRAGAGLRARAARRVGVPRRLPGAARRDAARVRARGQALRHDRRRLHRRQAPLGRHRRGDRRPDRRVPGLAGQTCRCPTAT